MQKTNGPRNFRGPFLCSATAMLSVIIPTLNEAPQLPDTLKRVRAVLRHGDKIIVADGGSTDGTREIASDYGACVVRSPRGRGTQLNAGADAATGDILLFLHADTHLPPTPPTSSVAP